MSLKLFPTGDGTFLEFLFAADHLVAITTWAVVDGQRKTPVAFLGDHPIIHVTQPVHLTVKAKLRYPLDLLYHVHDLVAERVHREKPLIDETEYQFSFATPACRIAMLVVLWSV